MAMDGTGLSDMSACAKTLSSFINIMHAISTIGCGNCCPPGLAIQHSSAQARVITAAPLSADRYYNSVSTALEKHHRQRQALSIHNTQHCHYICK
eukprot:10551334-Karenia_brevis.AAC.1